MTKIIMVLMLFGTHVEGHTESIAGVINSYTSMEACMAKRQVHRHDAKKVLDANNWIGGRGKIKIKYFNVVCVGYKATRA